MAKNIPDFDEEDLGEDAQPAQSNPILSAPVITLGDDNEATPPALNERHFYGSLRNESANPAPESTPSQTEATAPAKRHSGFKDKIHNFFTGGDHRTRAPMNAALSMMPTPSMENWQKILRAHGTLNAEGNPVDEKGKEINLRDMNPEFGKRLAQTCLDLDAAGHQGQYSILSGVRTHSEQAYLYNYYKNIGSNHPVALPGHSPHEWGIGTDLTYNGTNSPNFFKDFHDLGRKNGMSFVAGDINHCQIANAPQVMAELREKKPVEMAVNHAPTIHKVANPVA